MRVLKLAVGAARILGLACLLPGFLADSGILSTTWQHEGHGAPQTGPAPWVWLEAEEFAVSNFPYASHATRGVYCQECSGEEYILFLPGRRGRPLDPPGYWYMDWALRVREPGDYRYVWISYGPPEADFSWAVDGQEPIPARVVQYGGSYSTERARFQWARLDPSGLDLKLRPEGNPHTFTIRRDDPQAGRMWIDAILLTTDLNRVPAGVEQPPVDRSYLEAYPDYVVYSKSYLEHILPGTVPEEDEITEKLWTFATPGEYEPLAFAVYAQKDLEDVRVSVSDLVQGEQVIPAEELDLRVVRVMEKRRHNHAGPEETELVPEVLDYNSPQDIPAGTSKGYWLIIHVPEGAAPGTYRGTIGIAPANVPHGSSSSSFWSCRSRLRSRTATIPSPIPRCRASTEWSCRTSRSPTCARTTRTCAPTG